jgi:hypothetical protein
LIRGLLRLETLLLVRQVSSIADSLRHLIKGVTADEEKAFKLFIGTELGDLIVLVEKIGLDCGLAV